MTKCWIQNIEYNWQNIPAGEQWGDMPSALGTFDILFFSLTILSSWWWWWWWFWVLFLKYIYCFTFTLHLLFYFHFLNFTRHIQYLHYLYFHFYFLSFNPNEFLLSLFFPSVVWLSLFVFHSADFGDLAHLQYSIIPFSVPSHKVDDSCLYFRYTTIVKTLLNQRDIEKINRAKILPLDCGSWVADLEMWIIYHRRSK